MEFFAFETSDSAGAAAAPPENAAETKRHIHRCTNTARSRSKTYQSIAKHIDLIYRLKGKTITTYVMRNDLMNSPDDPLEQGLMKLPDASYTNTARNDMKLYQSSAMYIDLIYGPEEKFITTCVRRNNFATRSDNSMEQGLVKPFVLF